MLTIYLFALALGGVLLLFSLVGAESGSDGTHSDATEAAVDLTGDAHTVEGDLDTETHPAASDFFLRVFSLRNLMFALTFFGLTGTLCTSMTSVSTPFVFATALGIGLLTGLVTHLSFERLRQTQPSSGVDTNELIGCVGVVLVPITRTQDGQVKVTRRGRQVEMRARPVYAQGPNPNLQPRDQVLIVQVRDGIAEVAPY